jgi:acetyltransferase-like isoleucine patch superfamily enzyme
MLLKNIGSLKFLFWAAARKCFTHFHRVKLIFGAENIRIGSNVYIDSKTVLDGENLINDNCRLVNARLGKYSYVSPNSIIVDTDIGRYCSIGPACIVGTGIHPLDQLSTSPHIYNDKLFKVRRDGDFETVKIGNDVWIGANSVILGGVIIGHGAIIGANTLVNKAVPPFAVVVGSPCKIIKYRFNEQKIKRILDTAWWENEPKDVRKLRNIT